VQTLVDNFPGAAIPGVVDGKVLTQSIGEALARGDFARVPIVNGITHNEELIFIAGLHLAVSGGTFVPAPEPTATNYASVIASVLGVSSQRASAIAARYPLAAYPAPVIALSTLVSDANFACTALQVDRWTSARVRTFGYQFNDDTAPPLFAGPGFPPIATHSSEIQYLFDQPNAPFAEALNPTQAKLADSMRDAWAAFAARGNPSTNLVPWPSVRQHGHMVSLIAPRPRIERDYAADHHCAFWAAG
jgi:para-nitrobenzyl esterase